MAGRRKLTAKEQSTILSRLNDRDKCIFSIGTKAGFRISEILSLNIGDIYDGKNIKPHIHIQSKNMKGKKRSRTVPMHSETKELLTVYVSRLSRVCGPLSLNQNIPLFSSREKKRLSSTRFYQILKKVTSDMDNSKVATHSMRKTFANSVFIGTKENIFKTQKLMGHASPQSTVAYLELDTEELSSIVLGI